MPARWTNRGNTVTLGRDGLPITQSGTPEPVDIKALGGPLGAAALGVTASVPEAL